MTKVTLKDATLEQIYRELQSRGYYQFMRHHDLTNALEKIYDTKYRGQDYRPLLDRLFWDALGRII